MTCKARGIVVAVLSFVAPPLLAAQAVAQGLAASTVARIDSVARAVVSAGRSAGLSVAVARGDSVLVARGYGFADLEHEVPAAERTVYRIGSITKQFTAAMIMLLVEDGTISLDDELTEFLPDYPTQGHTVTLRHLLDHTSGIKSYTGLGQKWVSKMRLDLSHDELLGLFKDEPFDFAPGEQFAYNNSGYYLLGLVIERVTGKAYADVLRERVYPRAGLQATSYCHTRPVIRHRASGYTRIRDTLVNSDWISMRQPYSAGALCSTVLDLLRWQRALVGARVVSPESYTAMVTPASLNDGRTTSYGYGVGLGSWEGRPVLAHGGGINGFQSHLAYYPDDDLTVAVLANTEGASPGRLVEAIARIVLGLPEAPAVDLDLTAAERARYLGMYRLGTLEVRVFEDGDRLRAAATGQGTFRLLYQGDHVFAADFDHSVRLTFELEGDRAQAFVLLQGGVTQRATRIPD